jgi:hypothetical protein
MAEKKLKCPVCNSSIKSGSGSCPMCKADLTALWEIDHGPDIAYNEALALARDGNLEAARQRLHLALSLHPQHVEAHVVLGKLYAQEKDYRRAIDLWQRALELDGQNEAARAGIAKAEELLQEQEKEARARYRRSHAWQVGAAALVTLLIGLSIPQWLGGSPQPTETPPVVVPRPMPPTGEEPQTLPLPAADLLESLLQMLKDTDREGLLAALADLNVRVEQKDTSLKLSGTVPTPEAKRWIEQCLKQLVEALPKGIRIDTDTRELSCTHDWYVVQRGDTMGKIAARYYPGDPQGMAKLWEMNRSRVPDCNTIWPGQKLKVLSHGPRGRSPSVKPEKGGS